ncbi:MAG: SPOR domain-containing protein, partial [Bacteroidales bacterium]|nr:SPOR domain-containing protein [Bacteroidales bacterium]
KYLAYAQEKGFGNAYIITQYDLNELTKSAEKLIPMVDKSLSSRVYTIQLKASRSQLNMNQFGSIPGIKEIRGNDGYYRYYTGEYNELSKAREALNQIREAGFDTSFVRELSLLQNH